MEAKLLMSYDFVPDSEYPDKNLWTYNQFVFALNQRRSILFTSWKNVSTTARYILFDASQSPNK